MFLKLFILAALFADVIAGTWNLKWFPSSRAEHRASPAKEEKNINLAAETISSSLVKMYESAPKDSGVILFFQEVRGFTCMTNLTANTKIPNLSLNCVTRFKDWDGRLQWQQCAIASTLPLVDSNWSYWKRPKKIFPPRGYAYALYDGGKDGLIACFCIHLKSNYGASSPDKKKDNMKKREVCAEQLVQLTKKLKAPDGRKISKVIIAGDFNTDAWAEYFKDEKTITVLTDANYINCFPKDTPSDERSTHPGNKNFKDATLDYIFYRGFDSSVKRYIAPPSQVSDHRLLWLHLK
ncbi:MAG: endonuclease/exonuclease/phosphatase family protein [Kiritimatiellae bacterium]|nr:endonuclease/exonuclease/phosphatase family protein [Kiritimatiellia bacterium]